MEKLTAKDIIGWPGHIAVAHINKGIIWSLYRPFISAVLTECGVEPGSSSPVAVIGTGFPFSKLDVETMVVLVKLHGGTSFDTITDEYAQDIRDEMGWDGPDVMNIALLADAIEKRREALLQHAPNLLVIAQNAATATLEPSLSELPELTHLHLATMRFSEEELQAFLDKVPLTIRDRRVVRLD